MGTVHKLPIPAFRIDSILKYGHEYTVHVLVRGDTWKDMSDRGNLGMLYGVDISNAVYRLNRDIHATNPTVGVANGPKGFKRVVLRYVSVAKHQGLS